MQLEKRSNCCLSSSSEFLHMSASAASSDGTTLSFDVLVRILCVGRNCLTDVFWCPAILDYIFGDDNSDDVGPRNFEHCVQQNLLLKGKTKATVIHSFILDISIAPLQVHCYSEALSTTARTLSRS